MNHNIFAMLVGAAIIGTGIIIAYIYQKTIAVKYRGKVSPAMDNSGNSKDCTNW